MTPPARTTAHKSVFEPRLLAEVRVERLICYHLCYHLPGRPHIRPGAQPEGPRRFAHPQAGALDQRPDGPAEEGGIQVPSAVRHGISEGARRRRYPAGEG